MQNLRLNGQNDLLVLDEIWLQEKNCDTALKISETAIYSFSDNQCFLELFLSKQKETTHKRLLLSLMLLVLILMSVALKKILLK